MVGAVQIAAEDERSLRDSIERLLGKPLRDSKRHGARERALVAQYVEDELVWGLGQASAEEIDALGLAAALRLAADRAVSLFAVDSAHFQLDAGLFFSDEIGRRITRHPKADEHLLSVCLASHLAKVYRDGLMHEYAATYPHYAFTANVGYGTVAHRKAMAEHGLTPVHRRSFAWQAPGSAL